jgi:hypothetical protein
MVESNCRARLQSCDAHSMSCDGRCLGIGHEWLAAIQRAGEPETECVGWSFLCRISAVRVAALRSIAVKPLKSFALPLLPLRACAMSDSDLIPLGLIRP